MVKYLNNNNIFNRIYSGLPIPQKWTIKSDYKEIVNEAIIKNDKMHYYLLPQVEEQDDMTNDKLSFMKENEVKEAQAGTISHNDYKTEIKIKNKQNQSFIEEKEDLNQGFLITSTLIKNESSSVDLPPIVNNKSVKLNRKSSDSLSIKKKKKYYTKDYSASNSKIKKKPSSLNFLLKDSFSKESENKHIMKKKISKNYSTGLLNASLELENINKNNTIDYRNSAFLPEEKIKIKNKRVKTLLVKQSENGIYSPYFSRCRNCNERNNDFYDKIRETTAIGILNSLRETRK